MIRLRSIWSITHRVRHTDLWPDRTYITDWPGPVASVAMKSIRQLEFVCIHVACGASPQTSTEALPLDPLGDFCVTAWRRATQYLRSLSGGDSNNSKVMRCNATKMHHQKYSANTKLINTSVTPNMILTINSLALRLKTIIHYFITGNSQPIAAEFSLTLVLAGFLT